MLVNSVDITIDNKLNEHIQNNAHKQGEPNKIEGNNNFVNIQLIPVPEININNTITDMMHDGAGGCSGFESGYVNRV